MNELVEIHRNVKGLPTITKEKMALINERQVEIERAKQTLGRKNTQTTNQLMTLSMLTDSPYRRLRQCIKQIESRKSALQSSYFR